MNIAHEPSIEPPEPKEIWDRCDECGRSEEDCGKLIRWEYASVDMCARCFREKTAICAKCHERTWKEWIKHGLCENCQPPKERCVRCKAKFLPGDGIVTLEGFICCGCLPKDPEKLRALFIPLPTTSQTTTIEQDLLAALQRMTNEFLSHIKFNPEGGDGDIFHEILEQARKAIERAGGGRVSF